MATSRGSISVSSGLSFYFDAVNPSSLQSNSSTLYSVIDDSITGTLYNNPIYVNGRTPYVELDGTNDYIKTDTITGIKSIIILGYHTETGPVSWKYLFDSRPGEGSGYFANLSLGGWSNMHINGASVTNAWASIPVNEWFCLYVQHGTLHNSTINFFSRYSNNEQLGGRVSAIQVYNRNLPTEEIVTIFNGLRTRVGL